MTNTKTGVKSLAFITPIIAFPLMLGLTGCAGGRHNQSTVPVIDSNRTTVRGYSPSTDQGIEDSRTAERVREALVAGADYKFDGVKVVAGNGTVQLSGFVNTSAQRARAGAVAGKVVGVKTVENLLTLKD